MADKCAAMPHKNCSLQGVEAHSVMSENTALKRREGRLITFSVKNPTAAHSSLKDLLKGINRLGIQFFVSVTLFLLNLTPASSPIYISSRLTRRSFCRCFCLNKAACRPWL